jgi:hypothetical protein
MKNRLMLVSAIVTGMGSAMLLNPAPAPARQVGGYWCSQAGLCTQQNNFECAYGQWDAQNERCDISWPPPCPECVDNCCWSGAQS